jgi:hypothetical protein
MGFSREVADGGRGGRRPSGAGGRAVRGLVDRGLSVGVPG